MKRFLTIAALGASMVGLSACGAYKATDKMLTEPSVNFNQVAQQPVVVEQPAIVQQPAVGYPVNFYGLPKTTVSQIQLALRSAGFNPGPIDGVYGPRTASALARFHNSTGRVGPIDSESLRLLGVHGI